MLYGKKFVQETDYGRLLALDGLQLGPDLVGVARFTETATISMFENGLIKLCSRIKRGR